MNTDKPILFNPCSFVFICGLSCFGVFKQALSLDSEVNFGEVAFPQRGTKKKQALYQGTASAVPERDDPDGL